MLVFQLKSEVRKGYFCWVRLEVIKDDCCGGRLAVCVAWLMSGVELG